MKRFFWVLFLTGFLFLGGWLLRYRDQIRGPADFFRLAGQQISKLGGGARPWNVPWREQPAGVVRIASFNVNHLSTDKIEDPRVAEILAGTIRRYDVVALQEVDGGDRFALRRFLTLVNRTGRDFRVIQGNHGSSSGTGASSPDHGQQCAFLYDAATIELDEGRYYHINDPDDLVAREPLVAWFRTRLADRGSAFTFTLVNVHLEPQSPTSEMLQINQIFRAVRSDGRQEDDVIIAGDFGVGASQLNQLAIAQGLQAVNYDEATNTQASAQFDNLMIDPLATAEFTGEAGAHNILKTHNLTLAEALNVSDHRPVWAEFSVRESGLAGQMANLAGNPTR